MKGRKEYIIIILLIIGLGVFIWRDRTDQVHYQLPDIQPLKSSEISKLELDKGKATLILEKSGEGWVLNPGGFPADQGKVKTALQAVADLQLTALASQSGHYPRYGLDRNATVHVRAYDGQKQVRSVYVGKTASSAGNTYIRLPDDPEHRRKLLQMDAEQQAFYDLLH